MLLAQVLLFLSDLTTKGLLMLKRSLMAAGVACALVAVLSAPVRGSVAQAGCTVPESDVVGADVEGFNHAIQAELVRATGAEKHKERIAEQLRRGVIGVVVNAETRTVTAVTTPEFGPPDRLRDRLAQVGTPGKAEVVTGCHSAADLIDAEGVLSGRSWHPDAAKAAFSYSLRGSDSRFHVAFDERYPAAAQALRERLGDRAVVTAGAAARSGRLDDGRPHFGGAGIRNGYGSMYSNTCTSAFSVRRDSADRQYGSVTAGHCFYEGTNVYSGPKYYGYAWGRWGFPAYDILGIRSGTETYDNVIHVDPCCPSTRYVIGRHYARVGDYVCLSGMVTRAICGVRVTSVNGSFCDSYGCTSGLIEGIRYNQVIVRPGDSGGPIYVRYGSNSARAAGMIIAGAGGGTIVYGEHIAVIESYLDVTLMTS